MAVSRFVRGAHLGELAADFAEHRRPGGPFDFETVVVPSASVSGWLERYLANPEREGSSGVVAQFFTIYWPRLLAYALYDTPADYEAWSPRALGLSLLDTGRLDPDSARRRGQRLATWVAYRGDELGELLDTPLWDAEREVVEHRESQGLITPWEAFARGNVSPRGPLRRGMDIFAASDSPNGTLGWSVVAALAREVDVAVYLVDDGFRRDADGAPRRWTRRGREVVDEWARILDTEPQWVGGTPCAPPLEVHATVGVAREADAARDIVFDSLSDPLRRLEDIRVVLVNPSTFGPLVDVAFVSDEEDIPSVPLERADGGDDETSERLRSLDTLLNLVASDLTIGDVARVLSDPHLIRSMGLDVEEASRLRDLSHEGWVTMGWDASSRSQLGIYDETDDAGTWQRFLDRLSLSTMMESDGEWGGLHPLGVPSDFPALTRFSEFLSVVRGLQRAAVRSASVSDWAEWWAGLVDLVPAGELERDDGPEQLLRDLRRAAPWSRQPVTLDTFRNVLEWFSTTSRSRTLYDRGGVHVVDMASTAGIPYAVTVVVGLDDGFSDEDGRLGVPDVRPGDPQPREEFLNSLAQIWSSTTERLVFVTSSRSATDGSPQPWSSVIEDVQFRATLVPHPRTMYSSVEAVSVGGFAGTTTFPRFDDIAGEVAHKVRFARSPWWWDDIAIQPTVDRGELHLSDVVAFARHPQEVFARDALAGAHLRDVSDEVRVVPPWLLENPLERYAVARAEFDRVMEGRGEESDHHDSAFATISPTLRPVARRHAKIEGARHLATTILDGLRELNALPHPLRERGRVEVNQRTIVRGPIALHSTSSGPMAYLPFMRSRLRDGVLDLAVWTAQLTLELGEGVTVVGLCLGSPEKASKRRSNEGLAWSHPGAIAQMRSSELASDVLGAFVGLYDERQRGVPTFFPGPVLSTEQEIPSGSLPLDSVWNPSALLRGESSQDAVLGLLVGDVEYSDLKNEGRGEVRQSHNALADLLKQVTWRNVPTKEPWWTSLLP